METQKDRLSEAFMNEFSIEQAARELRALIGTGGFIRRDRLRRALFLSDYPKLRADEAPSINGRLQNAGWLLTQEGGLAFMDWPLSRYAAFFDGLDKALGEGEDEPGLCPILRLHGAPMTVEMLNEARQALLMWSRDEKEALKRRAEEVLGLALRGKQKVPCFYRTLLMSQPGRENESC